MTPSGGGGAPGSGMNRTQGKKQTRNRNGQPACTRAPTMLTIRRQRVGGPAGQANREVKAKLDSYSGQLGMWVPAGKEWQPT